MNAILAYIIFSVIGITHLSCGEAGIEAGIAKLTENDKQHTFSIDPEATNSTLSAREEFFRRLPSFVVPQRTKIPAHSEIKAKCPQMRSNRLKQSCRKVAESSGIINMEGAAQAFLNNDEEDSFYRQNTSERYLRYLGTFGRPLPGEHNCEDIRCPSGDEWTKSTAKHDRSFSPWVYCDHYNPNRFPQWISYAKCKCSGCMDQNTGQENKNFHSTSIKTTIKVMIKDSDTTFEECINRKCKESVKEITVGCHCVLPRTLG